MKMPWGKFKGQEIEDVPPDYLEWCLRETEVDEDNPALAEEMQNQIDLKGGHGVGR